MDIRTPGAHVFRFGVFELDKDSGELRRHGLKIRLPDQSFQILRVLLSRPGEVATREELRQVLWTADTFVDFEVGLNSAVRKLREALDDSAENPRFIETLPRRGYRFIGSVTAPAADVPAPLEPSADPVTLGPIATADQTRDAAPVPLPVGSARSRATGWRGAALLVFGMLTVAAVLFPRGGLMLLRSGPAVNPIRSLVVLPFENLTGDAEQDYFTDSVTDAVTANLAQVGVAVISRTSARQYKQNVKRLPQIGRELDVEGVVEGTLQRSGERVRITVKLIRASTDRNLWAHIYEEDVSRMLTLQQQIASDVAVAAGRPRPTAARSRTIDPKAYDAYIKGMTAQGQQRFEGFQRAAAYFEEAVKIQPDFAEAHAALAFVHLQFLFAGTLSPHEAIPKGEAAARRALQLDDTVARAHVALGQILILYHWRVEEGYKELHRAAELQGTVEFPTAVVGALRRQGRFEEAITAAERARKLDPLSVAAQIAVGTAYRAASQHGRAVEELRRAVEMSPARPLVHFQLGVTFLMMGRSDEAIHELEIAARPATDHNSRIEAYLGYAYAAAGRTGDARAVLRELEAHRRDQYVSSFGIALIHDALGEKEPALVALRRAYQDRAVEFGLSDHYPPFKAIAAEPEFLAVMRQVGSDLRPGR